MKSLYGYSLGGLFVLYALFESVGLLQTYLALIPTIRWNNCEMLQHADKWLTDIDQKIKPSLFMAAGAE